MQRNKVWTFLFSFCPGAGQMYQGYMKRGLSLIVLFLLPLMIGVTFMPILGLLSLVVWMYSFFDSLNLRPQLMDGTAPKDDYLVHLNLAEQDMKRMLFAKGHLMGWGFVLLGVGGLYKTMVSPLLHALIRMIPDRFPLRNVLSNLLYDIPGITIGVIFVLVGVWLIRGDKKDAESFEEYKGGEQ